VVYPIFEWSEEDVWGFIRKHNLPYPQLYDQGLKRIGCVGCPMKRPKERERDFYRWPHFKTVYRNAIGNMLDERGRKGRGNKPGYQTVDEVFDHWMRF